MDICKKHINEVINQSLKPHLKELGYKKVETNGILSRQKPLKQWIFSFPNGMTQRKKSLLSI